MSELGCVAVVLDPEYGKNLAKLAARMAVWIADTPVNRLAAQQMWSNRKNGKNACEVTTFQVDLDLSRDEWLIGVLPTLDLHHNEYSPDSSYDALEVFGTAITPAIKKALSQYGLLQITKRPGGFVAEKEPKG